LLYLHDHGVIHKVKIEIYNSYVLLLLHE